MLKPGLPQVRATEIAIHESAPQSFESWYDSTAEITKRQRSAREPHFRHSGVPETRTFYDHSLKTGPTETSFFESRAIERRANQRTIGQTRPAEIGFGQVAGFKCHSFEDRPPEITIREWRPLEFTIRRKGECAQIRNDHRPHMIGAGAQPMNAGLRDYWVALAVPKKEEHVSIFRRPLAQTESPLPGFDNHSRAFSSLCTKPKRK